MVVNFFLRFNKQTNCQTTFICLFAVALNLVWQTIEVKAAGIQEKKMGRGGGGGGGGGEEREDRMSKMLESS